MAYLQLSDIGKIYSGDGTASIGIRNVDLSFERGEFVAITGKSGSGKTTLLNIIGGIDSFEEGELYIEGQPTSHYLKEEWEDYSRKYISFIFQNYNILDSFTVYDNIYFALTSIKDLKERKKRTLEILKKVGLEKRKNAKGSVLSGGEKQRTVIARAIAKDSPIILADEPTGNLDSANAKDILRLLKEISQDKLVIVVTHNYDDVKQYATRHIRIFDGKIDGDEVFVSSESVEYELAQNNNFEKERAYIFKKKSKGEKINKTNISDAVALGVKRLFTRPKQNILITALLAIALCALFFCVSVFNTDNNNNYMNNAEGRVLVSKNDKAYTQSDAEALKEKYGAQSYLMHDKYLDLEIAIPLKNTDYYWDQPKGLVDIYNGQKISEGRAPTAEGEVVLSIPYCYRGEKKIGDTLIMGQSNDNRFGGVKVEIVGFIYYLDNTIFPEFLMTFEQYESYASLMRLTEINRYIELRQNLRFIYENQSINYFSILLNEELNGFEVNIQLQEFYYQQDIIDATVYFERTGYAVDIKEVSMIHSPYMATSGVVEISREMLNLISPTRSNQISLYFDSNKDARQAIDKMKSDGYIALLSDDIDNNLSVSTLGELLMIVGIGVLNIFVALFFAFAIVVSLRKLILATKQDIAIFRTMGIKTTVVKASTYIQLLLALIPAIIILTAVAFSVYMNPIGQSFNFVGWQSGLIIVFAIIVLVWVLAAKYNKLLYKEKVKKHLRRVNK